MKIDGVDYLDTASAAVLLGISERTVANVLGRGRIKGRKVGRCWYVTPDAVLQYAATRREAPRRSLDTADRLK